ncbi:MAG: hypothetical protein Q8O67_18745 [Deltaproteobacteria bacterium]|nr:hypothetical protein [Deltaproteobacteria bacterium]
MNTSDASPSPPTATTTTTTADPAPDHLLVCVDVHDESTAARSLVLIVPRAALG